MTQTDTANNIETNALKPASLAEVLPRADVYLLQLISYKNEGSSEQDLVTRALEIKKELQLEDTLNADDIVANVLLFKQSLDAAKYKVEVLKSQHALGQIASSLVLDEQYVTLLLNHYASLSCASLFVKEYENLSSSLTPSQEAPNPEFPKIIDALITKAQKEETKNAQIAQENKEYIGDLFKDKKISSSQYSDLCDVYGVCGSGEIEPKFQAVFDKLAAANKNEILNSSLTCEVLLYNISEQDALDAALLDKAMPYRLLQEDLQTIAFKYLKLKSVQDAVETLEAVLKRLAWTESPIENLGLAVRVVCDARVETLQMAQAYAQERKDKITFMRKFTMNKFFNGYEDELTSAFYGRATIDDVLSLFNQILRELPYNNDMHENADIGIKVLLKKLPMKDAAAQAAFRKENKTAYSSDALENEALNGYLGTKARQEVLEFFRDKLRPYSFWKQDGAKHCYALSVVLEELNGKRSTTWADTALTLLEMGCPEDSVDTISKGLAQQDNVTVQTITAAYDKFYASSKNHKDAALRVVNMLQ